MPVAEVMPPDFERIDVSFSSMAADGSFAARIVAPCVVLALFKMPTGIHTNFVCLVSGLAAFQSAAQCGHCASKKTYTVRTFIGEPTVKPVASALMASTVSGAGAALAAAFTSAGVGV